ncbi:MAG: hypothetical protein Q4G23_00860 [Clostridia bacterium]|nr:hypothetical protein [Clostridia bacterium]
MKKYFVILMALMLALSVFSGCNKSAEEVKSGDETEITIGEETEEAVEEVSEEQGATLPFSEPMGFYFSSGAGAWSTEIYLEKDGSFTGGFHDTNMGESGEENPYGTCYVCNFSGKFGNIEKMDETSYKMTLSEITTEKAVGEEWIEDGVLYVASTPYGLEGGTEFIFYTPDAKADSMPEEFLFWWPERFSEVLPETLMHYGIHNVETNDGFFTYE